MPNTLTTSMLIAVLSLAIFLSLMVFSFWRVQREDRTPFWLAVWLATSALFALCRLLQYTSLDPTWYRVVPRILLTTCYALAWLGYKLANTFIGYRPPRWERILVFGIVALPVVMLWSSGLILTGQIIDRTTLLGGTFHGVAVGVLYLPVNILVLCLGLVPPIRLLRDTGANRRENRLMAAGFMLIILFSVNDFLSTGLNLTWVRLSDFNYLPIAIFFSYIQVMRFGRLFRNMDLMVHERTRLLQEANSTLLAEIDERTRIAEALASSEGSYRKLIENARDVIFTIAADGTITSLNPAFETFTSWKRTDWIGRPFDSIVSESDRSRTYSQFLRVLKGEAITSFRIQINAGSNRTLVVDISVSPQVKDAQVVGVLGIGRNMTEEQHAEDVLKASEKRFRALIENSTDGIALLNPEGTILYISPATLRSLGVDTEAVVGRNLHTLMHPDNLPVVDRLFARLLPCPGMMISDQVSFRDWEGNRYWYEGIGHNLLDEPDVGAIVVNFRDITERKADEVKILRNAAEMTALYDTTHDLVMERDLGKLLLTIVKRATRLLGASGGGLYLCEPELQQVRCVVSYNTPHDYSGVVLKYGEGAAGRVAKTGEPVLVDDYRDWNGRANAYEKDQPFLSLLTVPLKWQGQVIGVLHILDNTRRHAFNPEHLETINLFANQAALAIENSRLFQSELRQQQEAAAIAQVGRDITTSLQLDVVLDRVAIHAKKLLQADTSAVYIAEPATSMLRAIAAIGPDAEEIKRSPIQPGQGILGQIAIQQAGEIVNDTSRDPRAIIIQGTDVVPFENLLSVPVLLKDHLTGLIAVWRIGETQIFRPDDLHFLSSLAGQVAIAIENARLFEFTQRRLAELEILQTIASALRVAQTLGEALPIIFDQLLKLLRVDSALLELLDPLKSEIVTEMAVGQWASVTGLRTPMKAGVSGWVISTGQPYVTDNIIQDGLVARPDLVGELTIVACVPVVAQHQSIGTLWVGRQSHTTFTPEEVNSLMALGEMVGNTIQRMKLHEQTERQAEEIKSAYDLTLEGWAKALELRDKETEGHSRRVMDLTIQLSRKFGITDAELVHIRRGVLLHDIGKMGVSDQILKKTGPLTPEDWVEMKKHPQFAYDLIYPITYLRPVIDIPYCHHEHWDGSGYPRGLKGEQIPLAARIFAIVDVYDALSSDRAYRKAWEHRTVLEYLADQSGKLFDPKIVSEFLRF